jgi:hypothetical protein
MEEIGRSARLACGGDVGKLHQIVPTNGRRSAAPFAEMNTSPEVLALDANVNLTYKILSQLLDRHVVAAPQRDAI